MSNLVEGQRVFSNGAAPQALSFDEAVTGALDGVRGQAGGIEYTLGANIRAAGLGFVSSFLAAELAESIGLDGTEAAWPGPRSGRGAACASEGLSASRALRHVAGLPPAGRARPSTRDWNSGVHAANDNHSPPRGLAA